MNAFRFTPFRWLWCSSLASYTATGINATATAWLALDAGAFAVGVVLAARMLPNLLFGLASGTLADRVPRQKLIVGVGLAMLPVMLLLSRLAASQDIEVWKLAALTFMSGTLGVLDMPARQALVIDSVPLDIAPNAMAIHALAGRLCTAVGALIAGALIPTFGVSICYLSVAGACLLSAALILLVRTNRARARHLTPSEDANFLHAIRAAARLVVDNPKVRTLVSASITCEIFGFSFLAAVPVFARDVLGAGAEGLGTLNAATSLGGSLAVACLALVPSRLPREPLLGGVFTLYGAAMIFLSTTHTLPMAAVALLVIGACAASFDVLQQTLMQLAVPEHQRGRAVGVWLFGIGSAPVGHLEMGALTATLGAPAGLLINGCLVLLGAAVLAVRAPRFRSVSTDIAR